MTLIELIAPGGALADTERTKLAQRLVTELVAGDGTPPDLIDRARAMTWLIVHEPAVWTVAGQQVEPDGPPRFIVRLTVPGGHFNDRMRAEVAARVTRVCAEVEREAGRMYREPDVWVHIIEMPDGSQGTFGRMLPSADLIRMIVDPTHRQTLIDADAAPTADVVTDPVCGMSVDVTNPSAITLEHDGRKYGFCSRVCRQVFTDQLRV